MSKVEYYRVAGDPNVYCESNVHRICIHCEDETFFLMTKEQYNKWQVRGIFIQDVFPHLDNDVREWMISGTHPSCWNEVFGSEDDEN